MERERRKVACIEDALAINLYAKGMGGIVDDSQAIFVGYGLYALGVARLAIDVHWHDGRSAQGDGCFDTFWIDIACAWVDIDKDGLDAIPPQRVGGGYKAIWCGDNLTGDVQCLKGGDERKGAIGKKRHVGHLEIVAQSLLQRTMEGAVVGDPFAIPYLAQQRGELVEWW